MVTSLVEDYLNGKKRLIAPIRAVSSGKIPPIGSKVGIDKFYVCMSEPIKMPRAVVAYFDVQGFSYKNDVEDIRSTMFDFYSPLVRSANEYRKVRFNVFSDCGFVASPIENAVDLLSAIRLPFADWISDGILVRGGIALGTYRELQNTYYKTLPTNFIGNLFSGSAVIEAVRLEGEKEASGSLLFTNEECAEFYKRKHGEQILKSNTSRVIGWSNEDSVLSCFASISLLKLIRFLSLGTLKEGEKKTISHLLSNVRYSLAATNTIVPKLFTLVILSLPLTTSKTRKKALDLLRMKDSNEFTAFKEPIDQLLSNKKVKEQIRILEYAANSDSSIPAPRLINRLEA